MNARLFVCAKFTASSVCTVRLWRKSLWEKVKWSKRNSLQQKLFTKHYLIADKHNDNIRFGMIPQFSKPSLNILEGRSLGNIIHQECTDRPSVICTGNCPISFLASLLFIVTLSDCGFYKIIVNEKYESYGIPNLRFCRFPVYLDTLRGKLNSNLH